MWVEFIIFTNHSYEAISIEPAMGEATGIANFSTDEADGEYYNLNGARVDKPTKGVYVRDGKKVVVK